SGDRVSAASGLSVAYRGPALPNEHLGPGDMDCTYDDGDQIFIQIRATTEDGNNRAAAAHGRAVTIPGAESASEATPPDFALDVFAGGRTMEISGAGSLVDGPFTYGVAEKIATDLLKG